jgi:glutamate/tyrosine decarboxylase-like PLP-dependent enzyme
MHVWDGETELFAHSVIGYAIERLRLPKDPQWGASPADELATALSGAVCGQGAGAHEAMRLFRDVLLPACRPMDDPMNLAYVPTAPSLAATMFDLVVSSASIFGGNWEGGAGAIAAENQAIRWLADLAGLPATAGGVFLPGGSAVNLSALATARTVYANRVGRPQRFTVAATDDVHASVRAAARVMDIDVLTVPLDDRGRMTGAALRAALADHADAAGAPDGVFAVVATGGTTNAGAIDDLDGIADVCAERGIWLHVDGAYGLAALASPTGRARLRGIERVDSFGVDPHKWLFAPYDCAALVYRDPSPAAETHAQHGSYLDAVDRGEWNPSDYAYHLSRRARGLPLWFSLVTYGTQAYADAIDASLQSAAAFAAEVDRRPGFRLLLQPELSVVLFTCDGWTRERYLQWSRLRAREGRWLVVPTTWQGEPCLRICLVNPRTDLADLVAILDDLAADGR